MSIAINIFFGAGSIIGILKIANYCGGKVAYCKGLQFRNLHGFQRRRAAAII
jgi:hypothetical protein